MSGSRSLVCSRSLAAWFGTCWFHTAFVPSGWTQHGHETRFTRFAVVVVVLLPNHQVLHGRRVTTSLGTLFSIAKIICSYDGRSGLCSCYQGTSTKFFHETMEWCWVVLVIIINDYIGRTGGTTINEAYSNWISPSWYVEWTILEGVAHVYHTTQRGILGFKL